VAPVDIAAFPLMDFTDAQENESIFGEGEGFADD
jgi:hypothetical protein